MKMDFLIKKWTIKWIEPKITFDMKNGFFSHSSFKDSLWYWIANLKYFVYSNPMNYLSIVLCAGFSLYMLYAFYWVKYYDNPFNAHLYLNPFMHYQIRKKDSRF